jgi:hypothetical protein
LGSFVLVGIALIETAGVWIPVLFVDWTAFATRVWCTLCLVAAAVLSAAVYYFPFDAVIVNDEIVGPKHPEYGLGMLVPFARSRWRLRRTREAMDFQSDLRP